MSEKQAIYKTTAQGETATTIAAKIAEAIETNSDINFDDGYKPESVLFRGLNTLWNKENGVVIIGFEDGKQFEIAVKEK